MVYNDAGGTTCATVSSIEPHLRRFKPVVAAALTLGAFRARHAAGTMRLLLPDGSRYNRHSYLMQPSAFVPFDIVPCGPL
jgi:hypothetical protein